jgi:hypothetical protein
MQYPPQKLRAIDRLWRLVRQLLGAHSDPFRPTELTGPAGDDQLIYRLKRWPKLPEASMRTDITRTLSVMSTRPVNRRWILNNSSLSEGEVDSMLQHLVDQGAVEVTDAARFGPGTQAV